MKKTLLFVVTLSYGHSTHPATPDSKLVSTQGRHQGWRKVWKSGVVGGIICIPPVTDLPKSGGACTPLLRRQDQQGRHGQPWKKPLSHFCPLLRLDTFVSKGCFYSTTLLLRSKNGVHTSQGRRNRAAQSALKLAPIYKILMWCHNREELFVCSLVIFWRAGLAKIHSGVPTS